MNKNWKFWDDLYISTRCFLIGANILVLEISYLETALFYWNS